VILSRGHNVLAFRMGQAHPNSTFQPPDYLSRRNKQDTWEQVVPVRLHPELAHWHPIFALKTDPCINLLTQQLAKVLNIPIAYLYCDGDDLAEILLEITSASGDHTLHTLFSPLCVTLLNCHSIMAGADCMPFSTPSSMTFLSIALLN
jgi:hypothetical protein